MKSVVPALLAAAAFVTISSPVPAQNYGYVKGQGATIRAMDKITGKVKTFPLKTGASAAFGQLDVRLESCVYKPPEERPSDAAFLKISERPTSPGEPKEIFSGWMFAASPALHAMEHPVYDIWVVRCQPRGAAVQEAAPASVAEPDEAAVSAASEENQTEE